MLSSLFFLQPVFQSTPSTRRETPTSLHCTSFRIISIHSLHTEGDLSFACSCFRIDSFQSTPSTRRETTYYSIPIRWIANFNPLPPHGGRHCSSLRDVTFPEISIHSLHTEGDLFFVGFAAANHTFQSTPSTRRETYIRDDEDMSKLFQSTPSTRRETRPLHIFCMGDFLFQSTPSTRRETHP